MKNKLLFSFTLILVVASCTTGLSRKEMQERLIAAKVRYNSTDWTVRNGAVEEVGKYKLEEARAFLTKAALEDTHAKVRSTALKSLVTTFPDEKTLDFCIDRTQNDSSESVRYDATKGLIPFESPKSFPVFSRKMSHEDWLVREAAITGICRIKDTEIERRSIPYIVQALRDPNMNVRIAALENVRIRDQKIYNQIRRVFFTENYEYKITLLQATLKALQGYDLDIRVRERVEQLIVHPNKDIRVYALRVLKSEPAYTEK